MERSELKSLLAEYLKKNPGSEVKLADEFEVSVSTVSRWARGVSCPAPSIERAIISKIKGKMSE